MKQYEKYIKIYNKQYEKSVNFQGNLLQDLSRHLILDKDCFSSIV